MLGEVTKMPEIPQNKGKIRFAFLQISAYNSVYEKWEHMNTIRGRVTD